jgi:hypothetical protein
MTESVGSDMPIQQARVRNLVTRYRDPMLRGAGELTARLMENSLRRAEHAMASGDVVEILRAYQGLREWEDD